MRSGDLVDHRGERCFVAKMDPATRLATLFRIDGGRIEIPDTLDVDDPDALRVVAHPPSDWKMAVVRLRPRSGPIVRVTLLPDRNRRSSLELTPWVDWVPSDPFRAGGSIFLRPEGPVRRGDVLLITFRDGSTARLTIPPTFGTVEARRARAVTQEPRETTSRFERDVLDDD